MKKIAAFLCLFLLAFSTACAEIDISGLSFDDLLKLRDRCQVAMMESDEWQEVDVPQGVYKIGTDIPAGKWTIRISPDAWSAWGDITYCSKLDSSGLEGDRKGKKYVYQQLSKDSSEYSAPEQIDINLERGYYLVIGHSDVVFTPYAGKTLNFR